MYNLSVVSLADKHGVCCLWDDTSGQKGSSEVATCLMLYLSYLPHTVKHVFLYSDTWSGQNRKQFVAALHHAVRTMDKIEIVDQKFLESGHSHMEFDAMHSTIERA